MYTTTYGTTSTLTEEENANAISFDPNNTWMPEAIPQLTIDMYYKGDFIYVVSTVAGVQPADLDLVIETGVLYIKGVRRKPYNETEVNCEVSECFWGEFMREIALQEQANVEAIEANLTNGILTIKIPILRPKTKKIQIRVT
jgi:HSP20 family protein